MNITAALDAAGWEAYGTWATALISAVVGFFIWIQVRQGKQLREDETRPFVVVDFDVFSHREFIFLTVTNMGKTLARNVRLQFDPPLRSSLFQPRPDQVYMRHPDVETISKPTTREAFEQVWKDKGWVQALPPVVDDHLSGVRLLSEGMPTLAPGKTIPILFDSFISRKEPYADAHTVRVTYEGERGRHFEETIALDLGIYRNMSTVTERNLTDIYNQLKRLVDTMRRWSSGEGGLKVWTRDGERRADAERMRYWEKAQAALNKATANGSEQNEQQT